jgi:uncharacterized membrane protein HdeD (DUF308 family)
MMRRMSAQSRAAQGDFTATGLQDSKSSWGWYMTLGILIALLGLFALGSVVFTSVFTAALVGWLLLLGGIFQFLSIFFVSEGRFTNAMLGILYAIVGLIIISNPDASLATLTLLLAIVWIVGGLGKTLAALFAGAEMTNRGWAIFAGIITFLLGILVWAHWPASSYYIVGLYVGIELLIAGIAMSMFAWRIKPAQSA